MWTKGERHDRRYSLYVAGAAILVLALTGFRPASSRARPMQQAQAQSVKPVPLLASSYPREFLVQKMLPQQTWLPFPPAADRTAWEALLAYPLNQQRKAILVQAAEGFMGKAWPALPATLYMEYARTGNRSHYEQPYFRRREILATLVLAECFEHRGRFMDEIAKAGSGARRPSRIPRR